MEVAVMSLSAHEQQALDDIAAGLAQSDPKLASLLATFSKLTSGEEMPTWEKVRVAQWNTARRAQRVYHRVGFKRTALVLWLLIGIALVAIALVASNSGRGTACVKAWSTCAVHSSSGARTAPRQAALTSIPLPSHRPA
jgi:Protein of unknown function (DUF3040)